MNKTRPHHEETVVDALEPTAQPHPEKSSAISYYQQPEQEPQTTSSQQKWMQNKVHAGMTAETPATHSHPCSRPPQIPSNPRSCAIPSLQPSLCSLLLLACKTFFAYLLFNHGAPTSPSGPLVLTQEELSRSTIETKHQNKNIHTLLDSQHGKLKIS